MSNEPNEIEKALAAAGLPPLEELAEYYAMQCHDQFEPLFCSAGLSTPVATAVALATFRNLVASLVLMLECSYPGSDYAGAGLEAFIADLRQTVARGPKSMEEVERLEAEAKGL